MSPIGGAAQLAYRCHLDGQLFARGKGMHEVARWLEVVLPLVVARAAELEARWSVSVVSRAPSRASSLALPCPTGAAGHHRRVYRSPSGSRSHFLKTGRS